MDIEILLFLQNIREALGPLFSRIAAYASDGITAVAIVIPFVTYWCLNKRRGQVMLAVLAGSLMLNQAMGAGCAHQSAFLRKAQRDRLFIPEHPYADRRNRLWRSGN